MAAFGRAVASSVTAGVRCTEGALAGRLCACPNARSVQPASVPIGRLFRRRFSDAFEVAPAVGPLGLPEAVARSPGAHDFSSVEVPFSFSKALQELQARVRQGPLNEAAEVQHLVDRALSHASQASFEELADLAESLVALRLRLPIRDMMANVSEKLQGRPGPEVLPHVVRIIRSSGQGSLFYLNLFEFCNEHLGAMQGGDLATYIYEAGRHGLRCRHLMEAAVRRASAVAPQLELQDVMKAWQGFIRFSRDNRAFYNAALPQVRMQVRKLEVPQLILALRAARDLQQNQGFVDLHAAACSELISKVDSLSLAQAANCLCHTAYSTRFRAQAQALVRAIEQKWSRTEDLTGLRVVEVVDALETFTSWGMKPLPLLDQLDAILVDRQVELKYTGNVSLWVLAAQAFAKVEYMDARWPIVALKLSRDKLFLEKISFFQQCTLVASLGKLQIFDETAYRNLAELLVSDSGLFRDMQDIAPVLWAYAAVGYCHKQLFDTIYDRAMQWFEAETVDLKKRDTHAALVQAAWSFAVAGYHRQYESFAAILDYAFWSSTANVRPASLTRMAQLADIVLEEAPEMVALCQCPDKVSAMQKDPRTRSAAKPDQSPERELLAELTTVLQEAGWQHDAFHMPDETSTFCVDVSLAPRFNEKVGLLLAGRSKLLQVGPPQEGRPLQHGGMLSLARRLLACHGWSTAVLTDHKWSALASLDEKKAFLEDLVRKALEDHGSA